MQHRHVLEARPAGVQHQRLRENVVGLVVREVPLEHAHARVDLLRSSEAPQQRHRQRQAAQRRDVRPRVVLDVHPSRPQHWAFMLRPRQLFGRHRRAVVDVTGARKSCKVVHSETSLGLAVGVLANRQTTDPGRFSGYVLDPTHAPRRRQALLSGLAHGRYAGTSNRREGIVIRPLVPQRSPTLSGRLSFKVISNGFLLEDED